MRSKRSEVKASLTSTHIIKKRASIYHHFWQVLINLVANIIIIIMSVLNHIIDIDPLSWVGQKVFTHSKLLTKISEYLTNLFLKNAPTKAERLLFGIGLTFMSYKIAHAIYLQYKFWNFLP